VAPDDSAACDACFRAGSGFQLPGSSKTKQLYCLVSGHQIVLPLVVRKGTFAEVRPGLEAADKAGALQCKVLSVDDMGAAATAHGNGAKYLEVIKALKKVRQDSMHQQNRVLRTQVKDHDDHAEAATRLKRCFRVVSTATFDAIKTQVCCQLIGAVGGLVIKKSSTGKLVSTKLLIGLRPRSFLELRDKDGKRAMSAAKFD
jgi:hypothetical protein